MQFLNNILSVSKYESKLLVRSWFFKVFTFIILLFLLLVGLILVQDSIFPLEAIPSMLPYAMLLFMNVGQAVVSIFLASEYLKRDKQLDTSEVFYVRPLSNAEYLFGKMWGTLRVFILLNFLVLGITLAINLIKYNENIDYYSYLWYFLLLSVPTLVFITGLSTMLMLLIKNQAITFVLLLGYIGLTLFYIDSIYYYLFDYIGFSLPMLKSTITGFAALPFLINHRILYLLLGLGFVAVSVFLFGRLPNSRKSQYPWAVVAAVFLSGGVFAGVRHVYAYVGTTNYQDQLTELNNKHVNDAKMVIDSCYLTVDQKEGLLDIHALIHAKPLEKSGKYTFCLNPGFNIASITSPEGSAIPFERIEHLFILDFGRELSTDETVIFNIQYGGIADERICYLDIPEELLVENEKLRLNNIDFFNVGKRYLFQSPEYVLLTPETYWYPRPGVSYSNESPDWQQSYFTHYKMDVKANQGLTPFSQGKRIDDSTGVVSFVPEQPLQSISLTIGNYRNISLTVDSTDYAVWFIEGHDYFRHDFDSILDTIPSVIRDLRRMYENNMKLPYPFQRFSIVEVPAHFASYSRAWTQAQEKMQPEMMLFPEKAYKYYSFHYRNQIKWRKEWAKNNRGGGGRGGRTQTDIDIQMEVLRWSLSIMNERVDFTQTEFSEGKLGQNNIKTKENPFYFFPQVYNFRYNIYSSEWPVANRLIEIFLQGGSANNWTENWMRRVNGLSNDEKALLMMQERSFKDLLSEVKHRDLMNNFISIQGQNLFIKAQQNIGVQAFRDSLFNRIKASEFTNLSFEALLDTMGNISNTNLFAPIAGWTEVTTLPEYAMGTPAVTLVETKEKEVYQTELAISNLSDVPGYIIYEIQFYNRGDQFFDSELKPTQWVVEFAPKETKRIVSHWEDVPSAFVTNTLISSNLPLITRLPAGSTINGFTLANEGEYELPADYLNSKDEIIVDNEDELFELSPPPIGGYFNKWIEERSQEDFKYAGFQEWRPPTRWRATTDADYYGKSVRSAYVIRSGDGSQYAVWRVPTEGEGSYEVQYHVRRPWNMDRGRGGHGGRGGGRGGREMAYNFTFKDGDVSEEVAFDLRRVENGWQTVGVYDFASDTIEVVLNNKTTLPFITADAIKFIKR